ncbi:MAG: hypothetical protein ACYC6N_28365 [Pirellulaceae bacterium]
MKDLFCVPVLFAACFATSLALAEAPKGDPSEKPNEEMLLQQDMEQIQGTWLRTERSGLFSSRKITKVIQGDQETVTYYDSKGDVERAHKVTVSLRRAGPVRIFAFSDQTITTGPDEGKKTGYRAEYVYKIAGDTFVEIWGVLGPGDEELDVKRWKRAPSKE